MDLDLQVTLKDYEPFKRGSYAAFLAPFNRKNLVPGKDYQNTMTFKAADFPNNVELRWSWPKIPFPTGVYNFMSVKFGDYYNTPVDIFVNPKKIRSIQRLLQRHRAKIDGTLDGFNLITDFFLTSGPNDHSVHTHEVMIFHHSPSDSRRFASQGRFIGIFTSSEKTEWRVSVHPDPKIFIFMPRSFQDNLIGETDIAAKLHWLIERKELSGDEYYNGHAFGVEVLHSDGMLNIEEFSVNYD